MNKFITRVGVAALATALAAWSAPAFAQVKIGVINSLSGTFAEFGKRYQSGLEVAVEEINNDGGINGEPIELVIQDDASKAESALAALESMKNQGIPLIIGTYASSMSGPLAKLATRQKIPLIILGSADDGITKPGSPWVFRAKHNSNIVAHTYFDYFDSLRERDDSLNKVAILYANTAWPASLAKLGQELADERDYEVVAYEGYNQDTTDFRPVLNKLRAEEPDILYFCSYAADGVAIARQLKEVGLNAKVFVLDTSSSLPSFIDQVGEASEYATSAVTWNKDVQYEGGEDLAERLGEKAGGPPSFYEAEGYLNLRVAADALSRAASMDTEDVRVALEETDLQTPAGDVIFENKDGYQNQNPIRDVIIQIQDGEHITVFPEDLAAQDSRFPIPTWDER